MNSGVALITGSGRRLGRAIALALAREGFDIIVNYNKSEEAAQHTCSEIAELGRRAIAVKADIAKPSEVDKLVERSYDNFERLDVLVNNAGVYARMPWDEIDFGLWEEILDVNLTGTFLCTQAVGRQMLKQGGGRVINIASIGGIQSWPKHIPYSVSKSAVVSLTRCFARALAPIVTVNAIAPGTIIFKGEENPQITHIPLEKIPLKRYGVPSDVTRLVAFLARSASYITGQVFPIDGGRSIDFISA